MWAYLSFVAAYWQWIIIGTIAVAILGYAAVVLKNWKIAVAALVIVAWGLDHESTWTRGYNAKTAKDVAEQTKVLNERIATLENLAAGDKAKSDADAAELERLRTLAATTPPDTHASLPRAAARRIGAVR